MTRRRPRNGAVKPAAQEPTQGPRPEGAHRWLLMIHQIPTKPAYVRVKIWRHLQRLGAIAVKNTVYALPLSEQSIEDFEWVTREITASGGEATICEARLVHGLNDSEMEALFNRARDEDYAELAALVREAMKGLPRRGSPSEARLQELQAELKRLKRRFDEISALDFFSTSGREAAGALVAAFEDRLSRDDPVKVERAAPPLEGYRKRTWVTRKGMFVDRIASAWLIRRFIDAEATFKYVNGKTYRPEPGELRFDMFEAEFTHVGDLCTFEVLLDRMALEDRALRPIAEIVHDIDIKDSKYARPQAPGVESLLAGIASTSQDDDERLARGSAIFDDLYTFFRKKKG